MARLASEICDSSALEWSGCGGVRPGARLGDWFGSPNPPFGAVTSSQSLFPGESWTLFWTHQALIHCLGEAGPLQPN